MQNCRMEKLAHIKRNLPEYKEGSTVEVRAAIVEDYDQQINILQKHLMLPNEDDI